ncbi:hypothetical protein G6011_08172 [Alternaria panax]|uniref:Dienelactone hydrolase domain-containing protein n=1 Tax=Alternaria panax TaxID=48097 RepID=A0AAD4FM49_9PLEO|nr:hypothetical protein G6011_08172 [Alternaria panax]
MTSHPMRRCCITGIKHNGTPKGAMKQIDNIRTYMACPDSTTTNNNNNNNNNNTPEQAIILMTDVLGISFPNTLLIADQFAQNGYLTLIPDVFNGAEVFFPIAPEFDLQDG